jgi:hypothetical protein
MRYDKKWVAWIVAPVMAATASGAALYRGSNEPDVMKLRLVADLSDKRLKMFEADTLVWQYPISDGTAGYPTPPGNYSIRHLVWNPRWTPPPNAEWAKKYKPQEPGSPNNPMRVVKIFFKEPDYYIHGTVETGRLGAAASHGCLRMDPEHVAEVARYIMEHGGQPREESWFWRVMHFRSEEKNIYLTRPVPLVVKR